MLRCFVFLGPGVYRCCCGVLCFWDQIHIRIPHWPYHHVYTLPHPLTPLRTHPSTPPHTPPHTPLRTYPSAHTPPHTPLHTCFRWPGKNKLEHSTFMSVIPPLADAVHSSTVAMRDMLQQHMAGNREGGVDPHLAVLYGCQDSIPASMTLPSVTYALRVGEWCVWGWVSV